jgi:hypothetical protein
LIGSEFGAMSFFPHSSSAEGNQITESLRKDRKDHDIIKKVLKATNACIELLKEEKGMKYHLPSC